METRAELVQLLKQAAAVVREIESAPQEPLGKVAECSPVKITYSIDLNAVAEAANGR